MPRGVPVPRLRLRTTLLTMALAAAMLMTLAPAAFAVPGWTGGTETGDKVPSTIPNDYTAAGLQWADQGRAHGQRDVLHQGRVLPGRLQRRDRSRLHLERRDLQVGARRATPGATSPRSRPTAGRFARRYAPGPTWRSADDTPERRLDPLLRRASGDRDRRRRRGRDQDRRDQRARHEDGGRVDPQRRVHLHRRPDARRGRRDVDHRRLAGQHARALPDARTPSGRRRRQHHPGGGVHRRLPSLDAGPESRLQLGQRRW